MIYTTPQLDAAAAVAEMLTGRTIAGFTLDARSDELLPTYELSNGDLRDLHIDCVPDAEYTVTPIDRGTLEQECPVNIGIQTQCGKDDQSLYRQLISLLNGIVAVVMSVAPDGFNRPRDQATASDSARALEQGVFYGVVVVTYHVRTAVVA